MEGTSLQKMAIDSSSLTTTRLLFVLMILPLNLALSVDYLPGYSAKLPFKLQTGYISVGDSELFYYFVESQNNPAIDPLFFWFTGGPGCSAFTGLIYGNGPIMFDSENYSGGLPTIVDYPFSWTRHASFVYVDAPVGSGFSYSTTPQGWLSSDTIFSQQAYRFIVKWLDKHPQLLPLELFVGGDSYAGLIVPLIVKNIVDANDAGAKPHLNIKGYLVGSPLTDYTIAENAKIEFAHRMTLISNELYESTKTSCKGDYASVDPSNTQCLIDLETIHMCVKDLNDKQILEPKCIWKAPNPNLEYKGRSLEERRIDQFLQQRKGPELPPRSCWQDFGFALSIIWGNDERVQDALHVRKGHVIEWIRCNKTLQESYTNDVPSVVDVHRLLTTRDNFRVLVESGDHDMSVTIDGTMAWLKSLNLTVKDEWRPWFIDEQVAGYTRKYSKGLGYDLTFATVKGAGHTTIEMKRKECYYLFYRWINDYPL